MEYTIRESPGATEIRLEGRLTFADHARFRGIITAIRDANGADAVLDLSGLDFADSSGLGMFIIAYDTALKANKQFSTRGARGEVKRLMTLARFEKKFPTHD